MRSAAIKAKNDINLVALMKQNEKNDGKKKSDKSKQKESLKEGSNILQELGIFSSAKSASTTDGTQKTKKTVKKQSNSDAGTHLFNYLLAHSLIHPILGGGNDTAVAGGGASNNAETIEAPDMFVKISKYIGIIDGSDDVNARRNALTQLHTTLFIDYKMSEV